MSNGFKISHTITKEVLSVKEHMSLILKKIQNVSYFEFKQLFEEKKHKTRMSVIVHFIALLELSKSGLVKVSQIKYNSPIWVSNSKKNVESELD